MKKFIEDYEDCLVMELYSLQEMPQFRDIRYTKLLKLKMILLLATNSQIVQNFRGKTILNYS